MQVNPYLFFNGNCEAALKFYQKVLGARIEAMLPYETGPADMPVPPDWKDKVMHANILIDGEVIMASDASPGDFHAAAGICGRAAGRGSRRCRAPVQGAGRRRHRENAVRQDLLLQGIWHVRRSVRHALDGQLPDGGLAVFLTSPACGGGPVARMEPLRNPGPLHPPRIAPSCGADAPTVGSIRATKLNCYPFLRWPRSVGRPMPAASKPPSTARIWPVM